MDASQSVLTRTLLLDVTVQFGGVTSRTVCRPLGSVIEAVPLAGTVPNPDTPSPHCPRRPCRSRARRAVGRYDDADGPVSEACHAKVDTGGGTGGDLDRDGIRPVKRTVGCDARELDRVVPMSHGVDHHARIGLYRHGSPAVDAHLVGGSGDRGARGRGGDADGSSRRALGVAAGRRREQAQGQGKGDAHGAVFPRCQPPCRSASDDPRMERTQRPELLERSAEGFTSLSRQGSARESGVCYETRKPASNPDISRIAAECRARSARGLIGLMDGADPCPTPCP